MKLRAEEWPAGPSRSVVAGCAKEEVAAIGPNAPELSLHQLHRQYFDFTWRSLCHLGVPAENVEDAAQDVWLAVHRQLASFEGRSTARTWLFGIVLNTARNFRRSRRRHPPAAPLSDNLVTTGSSPELVHESNEALALVQRFVDGLDEPGQVLFTVYLMEDVTAAEAADMLSVDIAILYERARRLRRAFKRWFAAQQGEGS